MDRSSITEKVRKLLAKATSQNENEAQIALLKARELMAKHKLTERDIADAAPSSRELTHVYFEDEEFTDKTNTWFPLLGQVIAEAHCCAFVVGGSRVSQKRYVCFTGLGDDPVLAQEVFKYAFRHIKDRVKQERKIINEEEGLQKLRNMMVRAFEASYSMGFTNGLKRQYDEQFESEPNCDCMALVMVTPVEVKDFVGTLTSIEWNPRKEYGNDDALREGEKAGYSFRPTKAIEGVQA